MRDAGVFPFEVPFEQVQADIDPFVEIVFSTLESEFLTLPKGPDFVEYPAFAEGYEAIKRETNTFRDFLPERVLPVVLEYPIALTVIRCILGLSPPEWAWLALERTGVEVSQGTIRGIERRIRTAPLVAMKPSLLQQQRIAALVQCACLILSEPAPVVDADSIHRLNKADTAHGIADVRALSQAGVPYAMLLYERFLGRPFATLRDSVSGLIGDKLESAIEDILTAAGVGYRKTKRAEADRRVRPSPGLHHSRRTPAPRRDRGEEHSGRRHGPRQGYTDPAPRLVECRSGAARGAGVRGDRLHRRPGLRCAAGRYAEAAAGHEGEGVHRPDA